MLLYDDVYLSFDAKFISKLMQDSKQKGDLRLFLGRAQWAPEQLQGEALHGSWYSLRAEGELIFDHDSEQLWKKLNARARPPLDVQYSLPQGGRQIQPATENALFIGAIAAKQSCEIILNCGGNPGVKDN